MIKYKSIFIFILLFSCLVVSAENISKLGVSKIPAKLTNSVPNLDVLGELVGKTISSVAEFKEASQLAESTGHEFSTYGGTSREIMYFVLNKVKELGSVENYRSWLDHNSPLHLVDWHRVKSDIDVLLIPKKKGADAINNDVIKKIQNLFPDSLFYANFEVHELDDFFTQFAATSEHQEPFSNIIITNKGFHHTEHLDQVVDGKKINLGRWGEEQFLKGEFDFRLGHPSSKFLSKEYINLKQYLRYLRMLSEYPNYSLSKEGASALEDLKNDITKNNRNRYLALIKEESKSDKSKIFKALGSVQTYSRDSDKTGKLLLDFGIEGLFEEAGFLDRIGSPLRLSGIKPKTGIKLGKEVVVYHGTTLDGAQNLPEGALYISDGKNLGGVEKFSENIHGRGFYTTSSLKMAKGYGEFYANITLSEDAILGTDVVQDGAVYLIKNLDAIAKNADGSYKIAPLSYRTIQSSLMTNLQNNQINPQGVLVVSREEKKRTISGLAKLLDPFLNNEGEKEFLAFLKISREQGLEYDLIKDFFSEMRIKNLLQMPDDSFEKSLMTLKKLFSKDGGSILGTSINDEILKKHFEGLVDLKTGKILDLVKFERLHNLAKTLHLELYFWSTYIKTNPDIFKISSSSSVINKILNSDLQEVVASGKSIESIYQSWPQHLFRENMMISAEEIYRKSPLDMEELKTMFKFSQKLYTEDEFLANMIERIGGVDNLYENNNELNSFIRKELEKLLSSENYIQRLAYINLIPNYKQLAERRHDLLFTVMDTFSKTSNPEAAILKHALEKMDFKTFFKSNSLEMASYLIHDKTGVVMAKIPAVDALESLTAKSNLYGFSKSMSAISTFDLPTNQSRLDALKFIESALEKKVLLKNEDEQLILNFIEKNASDKSLTAEVLEEMTKMRNLMSSKNVSYYKLDNTLAIILASSGLEKNPDFLPRNFPSMPVSQSVFDFFLKKYTDSHPPSELMNRLALHLLESVNPKNISQQTLDQLVSVVKKNQMSEDFLNSNIRFKNNFYGIDSIFLPKGRCSELFRQIR